jgi:ubiquinone/menaquinone biosynthesis C-methylase UbiE
MKKAKFTEAQTRAFYNHDDESYRTYWGEDGNCHWGYFPDTQTSFDQSMLELNKKMLGLIDVDAQSHVLDVGCGNGINSFYVHHATGAQVTGIDLSDTRIKHAQEAVLAASPQIQKKISFKRTSATDLPFEDKTFTHVWSQAAIYHVHRKRKALSEISRVLKPGGSFVFDDLIRPNKEFNADVEKYVFERLLFRTNYDIVSYQQELQRHDFRVLLAEDLSKHYALSYTKVAEILEERIKDMQYVHFHNKYRELLTAFTKTSDAAVKGDVGWALFLCEKI